MKRIFVFSIIISLSSICFLYGQDSSFVVRPINLSVHRPSYFELWGYCAGFSEKYSRRTCGFFYYPHKQKNTFYNSYIDVGLGVHFYYNPKNLRLFLKNIGTRNDEIFSAERLFSIRAYLYCGYKHGKIAFRNETYNFSGIYTDWLTLDMNIGIFGSIIIGVGFDYLLNTNIKKGLEHTYQEFNEDCFNQTAIRLYTGIISVFDFFEVVLRIGTYTKPQLNPDKFAYYNMKKLYLDGFCFDLKLAFRLYTAHNRRS